MELSKVFRRISTHIQQIPNEKFLINKKTIDIEIPRKLLLV